MTDLKACASWFMAGLMLVWLLVCVASYALPWYQCNAAGGRARLEGIGRYNRVVCGYGPVAPL